MLTFLRALKAERAPLPIARDTAPPRDIKAKIDEMDRLLKSPRLA